MSDAFYQAMAHPCRREIVRLLKKKSLTAGQIADQFDLSKPSISRHLETLRHAGLVTVQRRGNQLLYSLNMSVLQEMRMAFIELTSTEKEGDRCES